MSKAAIDSNVLVALLDNQDKWHSQARALHAALKAEGVDLVYFDCVLNETISVMARRAEERKHSIEFPSLLDEVLQKVPEDIVTWISADTRRLFQPIVELIRQTKGALNFHDALIALSCRELEIAALVSFDEDFDIVAGVTRVANSDKVKQIF